MRVSTCTELVILTAFISFAAYCTISTKCYWGVTRYGSNSPLGELPDQCYVLRMEIRVTLRKGYK